MEIKRLITNTIESKIGQNKVILLYGSRRVGKTRILKTLHQFGKWNSILLNGEDLNTIRLLQERTVSNYKNLLENTRLLLVDEAQTIPEIGKSLKLMIDEFPDLTIVASGSSSFDLANQTGEPLVGRSIIMPLFPISQLELSPYENRLQTLENLETRLVYGSYPEVVTMSSNEQRADYLLNLVNSYLLKDILSFDAVKSSSKLLQLLVLVAFQTGSEVSYEELGKQLGMSRNTVERYLDLLTKVFILYPVTAFSGNLRKEVTKPCKWYFSDNGIRNALVGNFKPLSIRNDMGALWENYLFIERHKRNQYRNQSKIWHFWRTYDGQEIDFLEKNPSTSDLHAYECKWNPEAKFRIPGSFKTNYPDVPVSVIHSNNYLSWITET
jgi:hypothetical protein